MRKLQDQNENFQANRAKMAEGMALALEKKDQVKNELPFQERTTANLGYGTRGFSITQNSTLCLFYRNGWRRWQF